METIWVMVTDSTVDSGGNSHRLLAQLADGLSQHWRRQVRDDYIAGKDSHNYRHKNKMMPVGLPASLPRIAD